MLEECHQLFKEYYCVYVHRFVMVKAHTETDAKSLALKSLMSHPNMLTTSIEKIKTTDVWFP
jgi:hypothetical protein